VKPADEVIRGFFRSWERSDADEVAAFFAPEATYTDGPRGTYRGRDAIRQELAAAFERRPARLKVSVRSLLSQGRTVMAECVDRLEVGGRPVEMAVAVVFEVNDDGLIVAGLLRTQ
jgi:limonene-1,2-epoxide hydrolase